MNLKISLLIIASVMALLDTEPQMMRVTCYTGGTVTASGTEPREGICAGSPEMIGNYALVYDMDMNFIDSFKIEDTGSHPRLQNGTSIDIYRDTLSGCYEWVGEYGDYMFVKIIDIGE